MDKVDGSLSGPARGIKSTQVGASRFLFYPEKQSASTRKDPIDSFCLHVVDPALSAE